MSVQAQITGSVGAGQVELPKPRSIWTTPTVIAILAVACIASHLLIRYAFSGTRLAWQTPLIVALVAGGAPLLVQLTRKLFAGQFGSDHLAGISIITSVLLGEY